MSQSDPNGGKRRAHPLEAVKTVLWGFFGVRRRTHHEAVKITPLQVILAGLIAAAVFVCGLVLLVSFVLSRTGQGG